MFKIEKNRPLPAPSRGGRKQLYPFADMEVGNSFKAPRDMGKDEQGSDKRQRSISTSSRNWAKKHNPAAKFTVRVIDENTVECWRTK